MEINIYIYTLRCEVCVCINICWSISLGPDDKNIYFTK